MKLICPAVLLLMLLSSIVRSETLVLAADTWDGYTNPDGTGYYYEIADKVFKPLGYTLERKNLPYSRVIHMIKSGTVDVALGIYPADLPPEYVASKIIVEQDAVDVAILPARFPDWQGLASLQGKSVVARIDYGYDRLLGPGVNYAEKPSLSGMLQMLMTGRVDAVADYEADIHAAEKESNLKPTYVIKKGVMKNPICFGFGLSAKAQKARAEFETRMAEMIASGELKTMYLKLNVGLDNYPHP